eukprot:NODE_934_length_650_cov_498.618968_g863_i0.p1 GENE.NODE_934_length_650_cov_498.618968_g863_i0~~NODE_934_length_650_cov_498.618968_g863_i0.p1  ORF type:complete len:153 (+),score=41.55 NODE_934_length_650_cov_498.618968_g863_i0:34-492(+)
MGTLSECLFFFGSVCIMSSGVTVTDDCISKFNELKLKHKSRWVSFKISDNQEKIEIDKIEEDRAVDYAAFHKQLSNKEARYYVFDFEFDAGADGKRQKILFLNWIPDECPVKQKMLYASSKDAIRKKLEGVIEIQANDASACDLETVMGKCK